MKKYILTLVIVALALPLTAQIISSSPIDPKVDGVFGSQEYSNTQELQGMKLGYTLSNDGNTLYFALRAPAKGWVSVGLGTKRMHLSHMVMGFDALTSQTISEETGRGHSHSPSKDKVVKMSIIKESGNETTLEFSIPSALYANGSELPLILAYGTKDDLRSKHSKYASYTITYTK